MKIVALAGGVGAARLLRGVVRVVRPESLTVVGNVGDDDEFFGLSVSPDLDTAVYNLAGVAPLGRGWGLARDSRRVLGALGALGADNWFGIGDADLATNLIRTEMLRAGRPLHEATAWIASAFAVRSRVLPATDDPVRTIVETRVGRRLRFQEWFVRRRARDPVRRLAYDGLDRARPAPGVLEAIRDADLLLLPPSNPFTSIRPILGVRGIERAVRRRRAPLVAVSPVAAGAAVRGPLASMLRAEGFEVSPVGLARLYDGLLDGLVVDSADRGLRGQLEARGLAVATTNIRMSSIDRSTAVARVALDLARSLTA